MALYAVPFLASAVSLSTPVPILRRRLLLASSLASFAFRSLFRLLSTRATRSSLWSLACPSVAPSAPVAVGPLSTPLDPLVSLRFSSFSNSPRWHQRPLCSFLDAEERLNANRQPATVRGFFCLPRGGLICRNGMTHRGTPDEEKVHTRFSDSAVFCRLSGRACAPLPRHPPNGRTPPRGKSDGYTVHSERSMSVAAQCQTPVNPCTRVQMRAFTNFHGKSARFLSQSGRALLNWGFYVYSYLPREHWFNEFPDLYAFDVGQ